MSRWILNLIFFKPSAQTASRGASGIETGAPIKKDNHPSESKTDPKEKRQHIQPGKSITNAPSQLQAKNLQKQKSLNKRRINQGKHMSEY